jgi:hypothetical protein
MDKIPPQAILPFFTQISSSLLLSLEQQTLINIIETVSKKKFVIDQNALEHIHKEIIKFLKQDAKFCSENVDILSHGQRNSFKSFSTFPISIAKHFFSKNKKHLDSKLWKELVFSGTHSAMTRNLLKAIIESTIQHQKEKNCLLISTKGSYTFDLIKQALPKWKITLIEDQYALEHLKEKTFDVVISDFFLSKFPNKKNLSLMLKIRKPDGTCFILDYITYSDDPALHQSIRQAAHLELIEYNSNYEQLKLEGSKQYLGFVSKVIVDPLQ